MSVDFVAWYFHLILFLTKFYFDSPLMYTEKTACFTPYETFVLLLCLYLDTSDSLIKLLLLLGYLNVGVSPVWEIILEYLG